MEESIAIARSEDLPEGGSVRFRIAVEGEVVPAFAVRLGGLLRAYVNRCPHRFVELDLETNRFFHPDGERLLCRAHGAAFEVAGGRCLEGPCPKGSGLRSLHIVEEGGNIRVHPE